MQRALQPTLALALPSSAHVARAPRPPCRCTIGIKQLLDVCDWLKQVDARERVHKLWHRLEQAAGLIVV